MAGYKVWIMPPALGLPNASPFVLKLLTWLRMAGIEHTPCVLKGPPKSPSGKVPYIEESDGSFLTDSTTIIGTLTERHQIALDDHLDEAQRAQSIALQRLLEEHLYWALLKTRWDGPGWPVTRKAYFGHLPWPFSYIVPTVIRRQVLRDLRGHGFGRMTDEQVWARAADDIVALDVLLGEQDYLFGEPSSIDATLFAWVANAIGPEGTNPLKTAMLAKPRLVAHMERVRGVHWQDWDDYR